VTFISFRAPWLGRILRRAMNERITEALLSVLGLCTLVIGIRISLRMENILLVLGCLIIGGGIGTAFQFENVLERLASRSAKPLGPNFLQAFRRYQTRSDASPAQYLGAFLHGGHRHSGAYRVGTPARSRDPHYQRSFWTVRSR
jgi:uncharacterized membrane protein YqgA involved in biofilm formation